MLHPFLSKIKSNHARLGHYLCLGLDPDPALLPSSYAKDIKGVERFLLDVIHETHDQVVAYKPNLAFFESFGIEGISLLKVLRKKVPESIPLILDAKRGDIGNTSRKIASFIFDYLDYDATTLHPYMGADSLEPFFHYSDRFHFVLCLTSNLGSMDLEMLSLADGRKLYEAVFDQCKGYLSQFDNVGMVIGATHPEQLTALRKRCTKPLFLVPGVGSQGATYQEAVAHSINEDQLTLVNISRNLLYPSEQYNEKDPFIEIRRRIQALSY